MQLVTELGRLESPRVGVGAFATLGFETFRKDIAYLNNLASVTVGAALGDRLRAEHLYGSSRAEQGDRRAQRFPGMTWLAERARKLATG